MEPANARDPGIPLAAAPLVLVGPFGRRRSNRPRLRLLQFIPGWPARKRMAARTASLAREWSRSLQHLRAPGRRALPQLFRGGVWRSGRSDGVPARLAVRE